MSDDVRILHDLSVHDAEELQAFVDKRKWFEVKLHELESHAPIYPFVRVELNLDEQRSDGSAETGSSPDYRFGLPSKAQVKCWQEERDSVEEQVVAFDGGDLERMKQKTRAVTLIPLTPPSTELVEVTLDLIVVVDRLLTLLRRRSELLELTRLRLKWDELRLSCASELLGMKTEGVSIVQRKCEWLPTGTISRPPNEDLPDLAPDCPTPPPPPAQNLFTTPTTPRQQPRPIHNGPSPSHISPGSSPFATPKRASLRIPLLHSQIVNLRIRHSTFMTTLLPRAGILLDKMIDIAGPLKGLGGIDGPKPDDQQGSGAVPEELLDAQEDLETQAAEVQEHVRRCQQLEAQCISAEQLHSSLVQIYSSAAVIIDTSTTITGSHDGLQLLWDEWRDLLSSLPSPIDRDTFSVSSTASCPQNTDHEERIIDLLDNMRDAARQVLDRAKEALTWSQRLADQRLVVDRCCDELTHRETEILNFLSRLPPSAPSFSKPVEKSLFSDLEEWQTRMTQADLEKPNLLQRSTIAGMKYRAISKSPPLFLETATLGHDDVTDRLDDVHESTRMKTDELRNARTQVLRDRQIALQVEELQKALHTIQVEVDKLNPSLRSAIQSALWSGGRSRKKPSPEDSESRIISLDAQLLSSAVDPCTKMETQFGNDARYVPMISDCREAVTATQTALRRAQIAQNLLERALAQTKAVEATQSEADRMLGVMTHDCDSTRSSRLPIEVASWLDDISRSIPFLSNIDTVSAVGNGSFASDTSHATVPRPPLTPPTSPLPYPDSPFDLTLTDQAVRDEINNLAAKVSGALEHHLGRGLPVPEHLDNTSPDDIEQSAHVSQQAHATEETLGPASTANEVESIAEKEKKLDRPAMETVPDLQHASSALSINRPASSNPASRTSQEMAFSAPFATHVKGLSLGRAAGRSYTSRRDPSTLSGSSSRLPSLSRTQRIEPGGDETHDTMRNRSISARSVSLGRSATSTPLARRVLSTSSTSSSFHARTSLPRIPTVTPQRSARKYVPDPASQLDVAVGDIVNGARTYVPIIPVGATAKDEYKDTTGSYWIGAEGRAKLCYCRILRSQMVMVRVGGGWVELTKFLADHFPESALTPSNSIGQSMSRLSLASQNEETSTNPVTPVRSRVVSNASTLAGSPDPTGSSPKTVGQVDTGPLTPLRYIKRASDSPDVRKKEKATLRIGRRSILGKE